MTLTRVSQTGQWKIALFEDEQSAILQRHLGRMAPSHSIWSQVVKSMTPWETLPRFCATELSESPAVTCDPSSFER